MAFAPLCSTASGQNRVITKGIYHPPYYPQGDTKLNDWLKANLEYPEYALKNDIYGDVKVKILVSETGKVLNVKVARSAHPLLDAAAVAVCRKITGLRPATQNGKAVTGYYDIWVNFRRNLAASNQSKNDYVMQPGYPWGEKALTKFVQENIVYPPLCRQHRIEGTVDVNIEIQTDGKVGEVKVTKSVNELLDAEAIRVCKTLPEFCAGSINGKHVKMWYPLSVTFQLPGDDSSAATSASSEGSTVKDSGNTNK